MFKIKLDVFDAGHGTSGRGIMPKRLASRVSQSRVEYVN